MTLTSMRKATDQDGQIPPRNLNHTLHLVLTLATLGLWLPVWTFLTIRNEGWKSRHLWIASGKNIKGMTRLNRLDVSPEMRRRFGW